MKRELETTCKEAFTEMDRKMSEYEVCYGLSKADCYLAVRSIMRVVHAVSNTNAQQLASLGVMATPAYYIVDPEDADKGNLHLDDHRKVRRRVLV